MCCSPGHAPHMQVPMSLPVMSLFLRQTGASSYRSSSHRPTTQHKHIFRCCGFRLCLGQMTTWMALEQCKVVQKKEMQKAPEENSWKRIGCSEPLLHRSFPPVLIELLHCICWKHWKATSVCLHVTVDDWEAVQYFPLSSTGVWLNQ